MGPVGNAPASALNSKNAQLNNLQTNLNTMLKNQLDSVIENKNEQLLIAVNSAQAAVQEQSQNMVALDLRFQSEIKQFQSALANVQNMRTSVIGLEKQMSVHAKAFEEIDVGIGKLASKYVTVEEGMKQSKLMDQLATKMIELAEQSKETQRNGLTSDSVKLVKKMQEQIQIVQKRMLDANALKDLDTQMQERVSELVENNSKLANAQRKQIQGVLNKVEQLEVG